METKETYVNKPCVRLRRWSCLLQKSGTHRSAHLRLCRVLYCLILFPLFNFTFSPFIDFFSFFWTFCRSDFFFFLSFGSFGVVTFRTFIGRHRTFSIKRRSVNVRCTRQTILRFLLMLTNNVVSVLRDKWTNEKQTFNFGTNRFCLRFDIRKRQFIMKRGWTSQWIRFRTRWSCSRRDSLRKAFTLCVHSCFFGCNFNFRWKID